MKTKPPPLPIPPRLRHRPGRASHWVLFWGGAFSCQPLLARLPRCWPFCGHTPLATPKNLPHHSTP